MLPAKYTVFKITAAAIVLHLLALCPACAQPAGSTSDLQQQPSSVTSGPAEEAPNNAPAPIPAPAPAPAPAKEDQQKPDRSFVKISDRIGSRDPKFPSCEYYISVQNLHSTWSLKDVAVDVNGTIYKIADVIPPGGSAEFNRNNLPCPQTSYHVFYEWQAPQ